MMSHTPQPASASAQEASHVHGRSRRVEDHRRGGHRRDRAHLADELVAIHGRHEDVADDQMGPFALHDGERFGAVRRLENAVPLIPEQRGEE